MLVQLSLSQGTSQERNSILDVSEKRQVRSPQKLLLHGNWYKRSLQEKDNFLERDKIPGSYTAPKLPLFRCFTVLGHSQNWEEFSVPQDNK